MEPNGIETKVIHTETKGIETKVIKQSRWIHHNIFEGDMNTRVVLCKRLKVEGFVTWVETKHSATDIRRNNGHYYLDLAKAEADFDIRVGVELSTTPYSHFAAE